MSTVPSTLTLLNWNTIIGGSGDPAHTFFPDNTALAGTFTFDGNFTGAFSGSGITMTPNPGFTTATAQNAWSGPGGNKTSLVPTVGSMTFATRYGNFYLSIVNQSQGSSLFTFTNPVGSPLSFSTTAALSDAGGNYTLTPSNNVGSNVQTITVANLQGATSILVLLQVDAGVGKYLPTLTYSKISGGGGQSGVVGIQFIAASAQPIAPLACMTGSTSVLTPDRGYVPIKNLRSGDYVVAFDIRGSLVKNLQIDVLRMPFRGGFSQPCYAIQKDVIVSKHHSIFTTTRHCNCPTCSHGLYDEQSSVFKPRKRRRYKTFQRERLHRTVAAHGNFLCFPSNEDLYHMAPRSGPNAPYLCRLGNVTAYVYSEFFRSGLDVAREQYNAEVV